MKPTKTNKVIELRVSKVPYRVIAERLNMSESSARVLFWKRQHPIKNRERAKKYYDKHKTKLNQNAKIWRDANPEVMKEYRVRRKFREAGVVYSGL